MKKTVKKMALLLGIVMVLSAFTGCSGNPGTSSSTDISGSAAGSTAPADNKTEKKPEYTFKYSVTFPATGAQADGAAALGKHLEKYSDGRVAMEFYPSSQLGDKIPSMEGLRSGTIEMTESAATDLSNYSSIWTVFSLPYLFDSGEQAIAVISDPEVRAITDADAEEQGFVIISWCNLGERSILNTKRAVSEPEDLKGIRVRVMQNQLLADTLNAMGASATIMAWSEVYTALQQKTIDGLENSPPVITANKMEEVAKYLSFTEQFIIPDPVFVSKKVYESMPEDLQKAVLDAGEAMQKEWNEEIWPSAVEKELQTMRDAGVQMNDVDKDAFKAAVQPVIDSFLKTADEKQKKLYETIVKVREKY